jgi:hypothetical protein
VKFYMLFCCVSNRLAIKRNKPNSIDIRIGLLLQTFCIAVYRSINLNDILLLLIVNEVNNPKGYRK